MSMYFTKIIKTGERQREFNFRRLSEAADHSYSVDVPDDKGNRVVFNMYRNAQGQWKTAAKMVPIWIHNAEVELGQAIEENKSEFANKKA